MIVFSLGIIITAFYAKEPDLSLIRPWFATITLWYVYLIFVIIMTARKAAKLRDDQLSCLEKR